MIGKNYLKKPSKPRQKPADNMCYILKNRLLKLVRLVLYPYNCSQDLNLRYLSIQGLFNKRP